MKKLHLITTLLSSALLLGSIFFGALYLYTNRDSVPPAVTINGVDISEMDGNEATALIEEMIRSLEEEKVVVMVQRTEVDSTWKQLGVRYDANHLYDALARLHHGTLWERAKARWHFPKSWKLRITFDEKILRKLFPPAWEQSQFGRPVNAVRLISAEDIITYLPGHSVQRIDWKTFEALVWEHSPKELPEEVQNELLQQYKLQAPTPSGQTPQAKERRSLVLQAPLYTMHPQVTMDSLQREGIKRKVAQFTTDLQGSGDGRRHNVGAAARTIHGMVLAPGDTFDYEQVIKAAEDKYGFREAPVIFGGKLVPGVGGGICQVSSTLYNAVILAGLDIVERRNHTLPVSYVPKGLDATFARGYINFRFKNSSDRHLLIQSDIKNDQLTVKLFGDRPDDITYDVESFTTKTITAPIKYVTNPTLSPGSQEILVEGKPGFVVESYRIKKVAGRPVDKTLLSRDTYPSQPTVIAIYGDEDGSDRSNDDRGDGGSDKAKTNDAPEKVSPQSPGTEVPKVILEDGVSGPNF
ncbi:VanW family protein [Paenibacillus lentus]|uniref:Vancomycin resistance protein n=1 Tax=Paenibacillus lentus TaxID=1338368 RepID=A0A3Q8SA54_9BACL|nr:VanW family protein [Paenibacillus lentus]AZK45943.1 vancomycin resistance protein [Paenibacillus lentus]